MTEPGFIRFRGVGSPLIVGADTKFEVQQADGTWIPLRGVCSAVISIRPDSFVTATMEMEVGDVDLSGMVPVYEPRRSLWQRFVAWVHDSFADRQSAHQAGCIIRRLSPTPRPTVHFGPPEA